MVVKATIVKTHFGKYLEDSIKAPVTIEKSGRKVAVLLSLEEYERLTAIEDSYWAKKAAEAENEGYLTHEESIAAMRIKP
ncbi:MAG: type II toxin-antitoxin system Phd/YefM family antitoxin [Nitrospirae bacterium]|nr:type II toxin-antitoxin system Phd/YefM family antitoxin [Nitrospirota bacterium]MBF0344565.1 type II toxin-antitoxin system Phd/YefM family antitoxin [Nitrospirota bacterium]